MSNKSRHFKSYFLYRKPFLISTHVTIWYVTDEFEETVQGSKKQPAGGKLTEEIS